MPNRQWNYYVLVSPKDDNKDQGQQGGYEIKSTNASRAGNKAKKAHVEENGGTPTDYQVIDAYRTNAPEPIAAADADE